MLKWVNAKESKPSGKVIVAIVENYESFARREEWNELEKGQRWSYERGRYLSDCNLWELDGQDGYTEMRPARDSDYWLDVNSCPPHDLPAPITEIIPGTTKAEREAKAKVEQEKAVKFFTQFAERCNREVT